jgi:hypothetical protein
MIREQANRDNYFQAKSSGKYLLVWLGLLSAMLVVSCTVDGARANEMYSFYFEHQDDFEQLVEWIDEEELASYNAIEEPPSEIEGWLGESRWIYVCRDGYAGPIGEITITADVGSFTYLPNRSVTGSKPCTGRSAICQDHNYLDNDWYMKCSTGID